MSKFELHKEEIISVVKNILGTNLVSLILYGSYVKNLFVKQKSDINLLIVRHKNNPNELMELNKPFLRWKRKFNFALPLVLTQEEINHSVDVYPMEYSDMKDNHKIIYGRDVFKTIKINYSNLRLELENQVKSKLIFLRESLIHYAHHQHILKEILFQTVPTLNIILQNIMKLNKKSVSQNRLDLLSAFEQIVKDKCIAMRTIFQAKQDQVPIKKNEIMGCYKQLIVEVEKIASYVDKFIVRKK